MANPPLSAAQQADLINSQGGGTFKASTGAANDTPGFMVALKGTERYYGNPVTAKDVTEHAQSEPVLEAAKRYGTAANTGWWAPEDGAPTEGNATVHITHPLDARHEATINEQEAHFAPPGTVVRPSAELRPVMDRSDFPDQHRPERTAEEVGEEYGATINTNMRDVPMGLGRERWADDKGARARIIGLNDVDPEYRMQPAGKAGDSEYSNYEVRARANEVFGGTSNGNPVSLQDVLNTINRNRVEDLRGNGTVLRAKRGGFGWPGAEQAGHPAGDGTARPTDLAKAGAMPSAKRAAILAEGTLYSDGEERTTRETRTRIGDRRLALHWATE